MHLRDPVAVYNAASNTEALVVRDALIAAGIDAFAIEDSSIVGMWVGGFIPEIHKPQVWAERHEVERVKPVLDEYEALKAQREHPISGAEPITVTCESCGERSTFSAALRGTVQQCDYCREYLDVGEVASEDWDEDEEAEEDEEE